jgi:hypothetical protein
LSSEFTSPSLLLGGRIALIFLSILAHANFPLNVSLPFLRIDDPLTLSRERGPSLLLQGKYHDASEDEKSKKENMILTFVGTALCQRKEVGCKRRLVLHTKLMENTSS